MTYMRTVFEHLLLLEEINRNWGRVLSRWTDPDHNAYASDLIFMNEKNHILYKNLFVICSTLALLLIVKASLKNLGSSFLLFCF